MGKKDNKKKLEQQMLFLRKHIQHIHQRQGDLMLKGVILNARKSALEFKLAALEDLIQQAKQDYSTPKQIIGANLNLLSTSITLFMN